MRSQYLLKMVLTLFVVSLVFPPLLYSGWLLQDKDGSRTIIAGGRIKHVENDGSGTFLVIDYTNEQVTLADGSRKVYATASLDEYCRMMQKAMQAFGEMGEASEESGGAPPNVEVRAEGDETVAGLPATKYRVMVDGQLYEELWLTTEPRLLRELGDSGRHHAFMECLDASGDPVESSPAYVGLAAKGWELRSISYDFGEGEYNSDTESAGQQEVAAGEFAPPQGYRHVALEELFMAGGE